MSVQLIERVRREKPIRELYLRSGITGSAWIGTPTDIADAMQEWFEAGACDGFQHQPATLPGGGEDFIVPELQRRELFRTEYEGRTLRENYDVDIAVDQGSDGHPVVLPLRGALVVGDPGTTVGRSARSAALPLRWSRS
jgi:hypothetical protein